MDEMVILRTTSHRSRDRLQQALGRKPQYLFSFRLGSGYAEITKEEAEKILPIKGITKARVKREDLSKCWE